MQDRIRRNCIPIQNKKTGWRKNADMYSTCVTVIISWDTQYSFTHLHRFQTTLITSSRKALKNKLKTTTGNKVIFWFSFVRIRTHIKIQGMEIPDLHPIICILTLVLVSLVLEHSLPRGRGLVTTTLWTWKWNPR